MVSTEHTPDGQTTVTPQLRQAGRMGPFAGPEEHEPAPLRAGYRGMVQWSPIIAGALTALAFGALSASLGLLIDGYVGTPTLMAWSWGPSLWVVITTLIAFGIGGYLCALFATTPRRPDPVLHGTLVWASALPLLALLATVAAGAGAAFMALHLTGTPHPVLEALPVAMSSTGGHWTLFLGLLGGLFAAVCGAVAGDAKRHGTLYAR